jgi:chromosome segregation ATPase
MLINNIDILGQQQVNIQKQLYFNTQKMELGANQTQLSEIDKAKADNKAALDKIVAENNENKARAEALLKEAQAKLTRLIEVGESIKAQREAARAKRAAELEKEILQKQAEAEERAVIDALFNQIKENNNDIKREIRQVNKSKTYFNIVKDKFEIIYNQVIKYKQDALITEKEEFDKAVEKLTGEFNSVDNSTESLDK